VSAEPEKRRLNLALPPKTHAELEALAVQTDATSVSEVIRRALGLYSLAVEHQSKGGSLVFQHPDGRTETLRIW